MSSALPPRVRRLFRLGLRRPASAGIEIDEEIRFHLEARIEQLVSRGLSLEQAQLEAGRRFGPMADARARLKRSAEHREHRLRFREVAETVVQDARIALRGLKRSPAFIIVAVLCLAFGIGANAAIYSVINAVLVRPLPFVTPTQLVRIWQAGAVPPGIYEILRTDGRSYSGLAGWIDARKVSVTDGSGRPERYIASDVTANAFNVLGVGAALGRTFLPGDNLSGRTGVVLLSDAVWRQQFGASRTVLGRSITIDGIAHTIVGVMPRDFRFPSADVQLWTPAAFLPASPSYWWGMPLRLVARLEPGRSAAQATAEMAPLLARARGAFPMRMPNDWGKNVDVVSLRESIVGRARPTLLLLFAAVGLVLMVACVNVATLYVDRATRREREIAVRVALGAGRRRVIAQLLTESLIVAALGAVAGFLLAMISVRILVVMLPVGTPRAEEIAVDGHVLAFTLSIAVLCGLIFGLLPAVHATKLDVQTSLRRDGRSGDSPRGSLVARMLAVSQVALAVIIVTAAGLLLKSLWRLRQVDLGFDAEHVLVASVPLPSFDRDTASRGPAFYDAVVTQARAIPGVRLAAATSGVPFGATEYPAAMEVEAHPTPPGGAPAFPIRTTVTPEYFRALAIPLLRGRAFTEADRSGALAVAVVDVSAAKALWPHEDAVGQRIRYVWDKSWVTVVGVVGDVRRDSLSGAPQPSIYLPMSQSFAQEMVVVVRADADADITNISRALRHAVAEENPSVPVGDLRSVDGFVAASAAGPRFAATLLAIFASIALLLGATGIYGVMTAAVSRRTREIGVRMALGATSRGILRAVLKESAGIAAMGVAIGIVGAIAVGEFLRGMLFGVGATDAGVLASVSAILGVVAMIATLVPARRASRVDPLSAIRAE